VSVKVWALLVGPEDVTTRDGKTVGKTPEVERDMAHADMVVFLVNDDVVTWVKKPKMPKPEPVAKAVATQRFAELETTIEEEPRKAPAPVPVTQAKPVVTQSQPATAPTWRRFECVRGTSNKFWEITLQGSKYTTRWGRIGTDGSVTVKEWGSDYEARCEYRKIIDSKLAKGYREIR
jgi:predicted DNA-binding WGR domain protein